jgi:DNA polymerase-3 subunit alpha (Gram-positive type)
LAEKRIKAEELLKYKEMLKSLGEWYFNYCIKIRYMFPKAHTISYVWVEVCLAWFKKHYEEEFVKTYVDYCIKDE